MKDMKEKIRVLLIIEQCNPEWASVPLEGYKYFEGIDQLVEVTLVTHSRNRGALERKGHKNFVAISESSFTNLYYRLIEPICRNIWPLRNVLTYPIYAEFNETVYQEFHERILEGEYDIVHAITPMMPRYPVKVSQVCKDTPFILGPVNGGVPFPKGFREVALREHSYLNFFRLLGRYLIPGYRETYLRSHRILAGSTYTLGLLKNLFPSIEKRTSLFYENGVDKTFFQEKPVLDKADITEERVHLLFVGRLVPYKGADMVINAINKLEDNLQKKVVLTIVGDGVERENLCNLVADFGLQEVVKFTGWVAQEETRSYYLKADLFCFPSVREFGGAVALEAMACGLPCIVVNNGGIGEYVTDEVGFSIEPISKEYVIKMLASHLKALIEDKSLRQKLSLNAKKRAQDFEWSKKAEDIVDMYKEVISDKQILVGE